MSTNSFTVLSSIPSAVSRRALLKAAALGTAALGAAALPVVGVAAEAAEAAGEAAAGEADASATEAAAGEAAEDDVADATVIAHGFKEDEVAMRNVTLGAVPDGYYDAAGQQGTLEAFTYDTRDYVGSRDVIQSGATVYLPYGYDQDDPDTRYDVLYLQHGAYGDERTWMYEYGDGFKNMVDHMIEDGLIPPMIIVMPYLPNGNDWYSDTTPLFYAGEVKFDLMPAVESHYHTYAEDVTNVGFEASRHHRAFGGFSAGSTTTWRVFLKGLDRFEYFLPLSGTLTLGGVGSLENAEEDAAWIASIAEASGYDKREYYVFAATGTQDVAYQGLTAQMECLRTLAGAFDFTETGFADGNLMYYTVEGNQHDYPYTYEYVFNGLRCLFSWETAGE